MSMFEVVGNGSYDPSTDSLKMGAVDDKDQNPLDELMSLKDIVDLVNNHLTYKDGWEIQAYVDSWDYDKVIVSCEFRPENSTPRSKDPRSWVIADGMFEVHPGTRERVQEAILAGLMGIEAHEVCEFVRFDGHAPFHPHRYDGQEAYKEASRHHRLPVVNIG